MEKEVMTVANFIKSLKNREYALKSSKKETLEKIKFDQSLVSDLIKDCNEGKEVKLTQFQSITIENPPIADIELLEKLQSSFLEMEDKFSKFYESSLKTIQDAKKEHEEKIRQISRTGDIIYDVAKIMSEVI